MHFLWALVAVHGAHLAIAAPLDTSVSVDDIADAGSLAERNYQNPAALAAAYGGRNVRRQSPDAPYSPSPAVEPSINPTTAQDQSQWTEPTPTPAVPVPSPDVAESPTPAMPPAPTWASPSPDGPNGVLPSIIPDGPDGSNGPAVSGGPASPGGGGRGERDGSWNTAGGPLNGIGLGGGLVPAVVKEAIANLTPEQIDQKVDEALAGFPDNQKQRVKDVMAAMKAAAG